MLQSAPPRALALLLLVVRHPWNRFVHALRIVPGPSVLATPLLPPACFGPRLIVAPSATQCSLGRLRSRLRRRTTVYAPIATSRRSDAGARELLAADLLLRHLLPSFAEKLGRPPIALELCLYFHTKDHDGVIFLDSRVEKIFTVIQRKRIELTQSQRRRIELTQSQPDTPIDETKLYLSVIERNDKGRTYGLRWTPSGSRHIHATAGGAGDGNGAGSSRPISTPNKPVELLQRNFQAMQTHILRVMQDHTLTQDQLREIQCQLNHMEQTLMDRLGISFALAPPRDVPADDSEINDDLDD
ncbi:hypothetical protein Scep_001255 [Stephania cephalantha]|uniref:Uncharacterized protein n=1 Tax=Stephania cephalantha TaxID=152367 RepID=A0AAP0LBP3_9MAGN